MESSSVGGSCNEKLFENYQEEISSSNSAVTCSNLITLEETPAVDDLEECSCSSQSPTRTLQETSEALPTRTLQETSEALPDLENNFVERSSPISPLLSQGTSQDESADNRVQKSTIVSPFSTHLRHETSENKYVEDNVDKSSYQNSSPRCLEETPFVDILEECSSSSQSQTPTLQGISEELPDFENNFVSSLTSSYLLQQASEEEPAEDSVERSSPISPLPSAEGQGTSQDEDENSENSVPKRTTVSPLSTCLHHKASENIPVEDDVDRSSSQNSPPRCPHQGMSEEKPVEDMVVESSYQSPPRSGSHQETSEENSAEHNENSFSQNEAAIPLNQGSSEECKETPRESEEDHTLKSKSKSSPQTCPFRGNSRDVKDDRDSTKKEEPRLHTEGVSEFLTHYQRSGYTEDSLRQFVVLDDLGSGSRKRKRDAADGEDDGDEDEDESDEEDNDENQDSSDSYYDETDHSDVPDDEIERMLEEGLSEKYKVKRQKLANGKYAKKLDPGQCENRRKLVLDEITTNHFEMLPEGWVQVTHNTGIPIYLHKLTRVCTAAMPYFLGPGSARKHKVPISAIPCLQYRKALEKEKNKEFEANNSENSSENLDAGKQADTDVLHISPLEQTHTSPLEQNTATKEMESDASVDKKNETLVSQTNDNATTDVAVDNGESSDGKVEDQILTSLPSARIETAKENAEAVNMSHLELRDYCQRLFRFKTIEVMRFKTWAERRKFAKVKKKERQLQRPSLPDGTKLISFPILEGGDSVSGGRAKKEWIMNPNGKSYVCILHEYVQHALKKQPVYEFKDLENPATPYSATVSINKMKYGTGVGTSKKQAKAEAAKLTLEILIPEMRQKIENDSHKGGRGPGRVQHSDLSFFDEIKIEDPRVQEFCAKTTEPSPYAILLTCLKRNFGLSDIDINYQVNTLRHQKNEFKMTVGNHSATVICKNKREGKQRASQSILQAMHPHINNWGSLLRLYGSRSIKTPREKKIEEQEITTLQNRASANQPNWAILGKLKEAMLKLEESRAAVKPIGEFVPPDDVELPSTSSSNLKNIEL